MTPQGPLTVAYSMDRSAIRIGDPAELVVTTLCPTNGVIELPEIGRGKEVVLLKRDTADVPRGDGFRQTQYRYSITSFRTGEHQVSTGTVVCAVDDQIYTTPFPAAALTVESSLPADASAQLADIKPVQKLPARIPLWVWILPGAAVAAFLIGRISSRLRSRRAQPAPAAPPVPPHVAALRALDALKSEGLLERNECNPFYTRLSLILRTYLEGRFHLNAPDETTEEIVEEMSRSPELSGAQRNILQAFMRQADEVKFAQGSPDRRTMESAFDTAKHFVEETRQDRTDRTD